jgi:hypothetical protein
VQINYSTIHPGLCKPGLSPRYVNVQEMFPRAESHVNSVALSVQGDRAVPLIHGSRAVILRHHDHVDQAADERGGRHARHGVQRDLFPLFGLVAELADLIVPDALDQRPGVGQGDGERGQDEMDGREDGTEEEALALLEVSGLQHPLLVGGGAEGVERAVQGEASGSSGYGGPVEAVIAPLRHVFFGDEAPVDDKVRRSDALGDDEQPRDALDRPAQPPRHRGEQAGSRSVVQTVDLIPRDGPGGKRGGPVVGVVAPPAEDGHPPPDKGAGKGISCGDPLEKADTLEATAGIGVAVLAFVEVYHECGEVHHDSRVARAPRGQSVGQEGRRQRLGRDDIEVFDAMQNLTPRGILLLLGTQHFVVPGEVSLVEERLEALTGLRLQMAREGGTEATRGRGTVVKTLLRDSVLVERKLGTIDLKSRRVGVPATDRDPDEEALDGHSGEQERTDDEKSGKGVVLAPATARAGSCVGLATIVIEVSAKDTHCEVR